MPNSPYESISRYRSDQDRYYAHNTIKKKPPERPPVKPHQKIEIEKSRLRLIAKGGKWVLFGLIFPFYFLFAAAPHWIFRHISRGVRFLKELGAKALAAVLAPFYRLAAIARAVVQKIKTALHKVFIAPFLWLRQAIRMIKIGLRQAIDKIKAAPQRVITKLCQVIDKIKAAPQRVITKLRRMIQKIRAAPQRVMTQLRQAMHKIFNRLGRMIQKFKSTLIQVFIAPFIRLHQRIKEGFITLLAYPSALLRRLKARLLAPIQSALAKVQAVRAMLAARVKRLSLPRWQKPHFKVFQTLAQKKEKMKRLLGIRYKAMYAKVLGILDKIPAVRLLKIPKIKLPRIPLPTIKLPKISIELKWLKSFKRFSFKPKLKFKLLPPFIPKVFARLAEYKMMVNNGIKLLCAYWRSQVKEMIASTFKFD